MKGKMHSPLGLTRRSDLPRILAAAGMVGQLALVGCASDTDPVRAVASAGTAGARANAGAPSTTVGGNVQTGVETGGNANAGTVSTLENGAGAGGAAVNTAGTAGAMLVIGGAGGRTSSDPGTISRAGAVSCPAFQATGGTMVTPPSNGFEANSTGWTSMRNDATALSLQLDPGNACNGSSYLVDNGAVRNAGWDGPAIDVFPYLTSGHQYLATLAARFDPSNAPLGAANIGLTTVAACADKTIASGYTSLQTVSTRTDWVRLSGTLKTSLSNCTQISRLQVYVETDDANHTFSLDVDDFQLWDVTSANGGTGGAGGAGGVTGSAGNAGRAGGSGIGGSAGGTGGSPANAGSAGRAVASAGGSAGAAGGS